MQTIGRGVRSLVDLLFPPVCHCCGGWDELTAGLFCAPCADHIYAERHLEACPTCATSVAPFEVSKGRCSRCRARATRIAGTVRVGPYAPYLARLLRAYKYKSREEFEPILGGWLTEALERAPWRQRVEAIVAVPTHWRRRIHRPFHAAERLAAFLAHQARLPQVRILRRVRAGPHQIGLSYPERARNVLGAFALCSGVKLHNARLLLVDDVRTTGATLDECAKVLRRNGAAEVYAAVVVTVGWRSGQDDLLKTI